MTREASRRSVPRARTRVFIVDDHSLVRRSIRAYLEALGMVVVAEAKNGEQTLRLLEEMREAGALPDVVLMDLMMPGMGGVTATGRISRYYPEVRVIVLTGLAHTERIAAALANGAEQYLFKDATPADIAHAIEQAKARESGLDRVP